MSPRWRPRLERRVNTPSISNSSRRSPEITTIDTSSYRRRRRHHHNQEAWPGTIRRCRQDCINSSSLGQELVGTRRSRRLPRQWRRQYRHHRRPHHHQATATPGEESVPSVRPPRWVSGAAWPAVTDRHRLHQARCCSVASVRTMPRRRAEPAADEERALLRQPEESEDPRARPTPQRRSRANGRPRRMRS